MSDAFYFACLGVEVVAAIAMPIAATEFAKACSHVGLRAGSIAALAALGIGASLPFARTSELPWLPILSLLYFGGVVLTLSLYFLKQRSVSA